jgi:cysteinyl-tRNA synthetase
MRDDLALPQALALLWETLRDDELTPAQIYDALVVADEVLGLKLSDPPPVAPPPALPEDIEEMVQERDKARQARDFARSDELRIHIENRGYLVEDSPHGTVVTTERG